MHREDIAKMSCLKLLRQRVQEPVDAAFHSHGVRVARWPRLTIMCSILLTTVSMAGLIRFHNEANYVDVWLPPKSVSLYFSIVDTTDYSIVHVISIKNRRASPNLTDNP